MRRLAQVRTETDLVAHGPGQSPQRSFFAGELDQLLLEGVDGGVAFFVVDVVAEGGVDDGLEEKHGQIRPN